MWFGESGVCLWRFLLVSGTVSRWSVRVLMIIRVAWAATTAFAVMRVLHTRGTMSSRKGDPNLQVQEGV